MQSSLDENRDESGRLEEIAGSPSVSWGSTNSDDFSEIERIFPRIGDKYQVYVPPYKAQVDCSQMGITESMNCRSERDENIMWWFAEALPVMWIHCFPPFIGVKDYEMTHVDRSFSDNAPTHKELSSLSVHTHSGNHQQDVFQNADVRFVHEMSDNYKLTEDKLNLSLTDSKTEISQADDTCTNSNVTAENVPGTFCSHRVKQRKRSRLCWKKVEKIKVNSFDSNIQTQHLRLYDTGNISNSKSYVIVPGNPCSIWHKSEEDLFLLGLYIFGKNFKAVKRFVETKKMEDILSYYYGMFFRTESYCRWTESRKTRSRKRIQGRRIFSEWRQQELLMRLLPYIPQNSKHKVSEITRTFNEGKIYLEEFVTMLKTLVGPDVLFQAVGIGKGKEDLTSTLTEPEKTSQGLSSRYEIPVGRACSSLSTEDIVQFLTGDFRLSKARANDLFWEAVWPRLLARGWHSEQPEDQVPFGARQSLVFLIPGVHKFSRRNLTKGIHYFDSLSEILSRVASDPRLLELDSDEARGVEGNPEFLWVSENAEVENRDARNSHCYLQPRICKSNSDSLIFTVVDTSLISQGDQSRRIRRRVTLPSDDASKKLETAFSETEDKNSLPSQLTEQQCCKDHTEEDLFNSSAEECTDIAIKLAENIRCLGSHKASNPDDNNVLLSSTNERRLSTYNDCKDDPVDSCLIESGVSQVQRAMPNFYSKEETSVASLGANSIGKIIPVVSLPRDNYERGIDTSILCGDSSFANNVSTTSQNSRECRMISEMGLSSKWQQDQTESTAMNSVLVTGSELIMNGPKSEDHSLHESSSEFSSEEPNKKSGVAETGGQGLQENHCGGTQQNNTSVVLENAPTGLRQSTRVRPLTARALNAFASGYFTPKRRKRGGEKTSSSEGYRTKSLSSLVHDQLSSSFNACSSDC